jgi:Domain of unknown function (DUF5679)
MSENEDKDQEPDIPPDFSEKRDADLHGIAAYCIRCKARRNMKHQKQVTMKNGQNAITGECAVCGTKMFKIGGVKKPPKRITKIERRKPKSTKMKRLRRA